MSIIFISMRPQSVGVNLILPREKTENDRGNESCLRSLRHGPNYFSPSRSRWIVQLEFVHYSNVSCSCDNWLAIFQIAPYDIFIRKCVLARYTHKKETNGGKSYQSLPWKFRKEAEGGERNNLKTMAKWWTSFCDSTIKRETNFLRKISNVSHRSSIFSRFISLRRNYAERSAGVPCLFIPWDCAFFPVQFRSRNLHPPTLESSTDVPFSCCSYAGSLPTRCSSMYVRFSDEIGCPVVSFQWCSINLGSISGEMLLK